MNNYLIELEEKISSAFPYINVFISEITEFKEYYILIDNDKIFNTEEFQLFLLDLNINYLLKNKIFNVFFSYEVNFQSIKINNLGLKKQLTNIIYNIGEDCYYNHIEQPNKYTINMVA